MFSILICLQSSVPSNLFMIIFYTSGCLSAYKSDSFLGLLQLRQAKTEIVSASKVAYRFLAGVTNNAIAAPESPGNSTRGTPRFQAAWFKNLITTGAKPSSSTEIENKEEDVLRHHQQSDAESPPRQKSYTWRTT